MYNDYHYYPYQGYQAFTPRMNRGNGLRGLFRRSSTLGSFGYPKPKFNWSGFLSNTQKTLNVVNQAIPIFYQIRPIWNNAKTMFRIMGAIKEDDDEPKETSNTSTSKQAETTTSNTTYLTNDNQPQFFL